MSGLSRRLGSLLFVPPGKTCVSANALSTIDFFLCSATFSRAVSKVECDRSWSSRPHHPVRLQLKDQATRLYQLVYRCHQKLPVELPYGPQPQPQDWSTPRDMAETAARAALESP
eukprot:6906535-Pyramimonas_sp.AAC.1